MVLVGYDEEMVPGDECGLNFLTFVLQLRKNPGKTLSQECMCLVLVSRALTLVSLMHATSSCREEAGRFWSRPDVTEDATRSGSYRLPEDDDKCHLHQ